MTGDPRDYKLDVTGLSQQADDGAAAGGEARPFLGVKFNCCGTYQRVYRSADGQFYRGRCPRCMRAIEFKVGPGGSDARFFVVD
jgi:hypothetical protein